MQVLYALLLPVMVLFCGLSLDLGVLEMTKLRMQSAADAAAIGAELEAERDTGNTLTVAQGIASLNGFTDDSGVTTTVALIKSPTTQGDFSGRYDTLTVTITQQEKAVFMAISGHGKVTMSASSTTRIPPCMYALGSKSLATFAMNESPSSAAATQMVSDCPIYVNGNMYSGSSNTLTVPETLITGGAGGSSMGGTIASGTVFGSPTISDPLSSVTQPSFSGTCTYTSYSYTTSGGTVALSPGDYCKGLTLGNSSNSTCGTCITTVTLSPGLYVITGGANWQHVKMTGTGVTLFFTTGGGASYGQINVGSNSTINISAPTSDSAGSLAGIVVFLDRNWTATAAQDLIFSSSTFGATSPGGDGIWYLPSTGIKFSTGSWKCTNYCSIIADNITSSGWVFDPLDNFSTISGGNPFRTASVLVQ